MKAPEPQLSTNTSEFRISSSNAVLQRGLRRSMETLFLFRLTPRNRELVSRPSSEVMNGPRVRARSPVRGRSILITSAPISAKIIEQNGPATIWVASNTLIPSKGSGSLSLACVIIAPRLDLPLDWEHV